MEKKTSVDTKKNSKRNISTQKIVPHLWFDSEAEEAANFYTSLFDNSGIGAKSFYGKAGHEIHGQPEGKLMTIEFDLDGYRFIGLNAGPLFKFTPAISFFVVCETENEIDRLWKEFSDRGSELMPLDKYEWSEKYGWIKDRFGLSWQLSLGKLEDVGQKITPCLTYVSEQGEAEEAVNLYTSVFEDSDIDGIMRYGAGQDQPEGAVMHAQFRLNGEVFMAMDTSPKHADWGFNEAISLLIECESQDEVDHFWSLSAVPEAEQCGWLKDEFGVSWQVSPTELRSMLLDSDKEKTQRVTNAFLQMKKFDIEKLRNAYSGKSTVK